ncbi:hypothetical protein A6A08_14905 [Nocardiopsis sp. TSRI0078]|uniref:hypothetical protein n=1 Tax=unclassified Nocardiopsis TaxID=2649073 RepID=UPI000939FC86|nr:hypothetical protein [Nocardiopsis sp. TSRI0078]OKI13575.1 hypothetical protein A6A08_14905 [Nocardiopsis sp. TSRI0078]
MEHDTRPRPRDHATLHDHVALDEIELYAEVLIAVADADHRLTHAEIDRVLGVSPPDGAAVPAGGTPAPRTDTAGERCSRPVRPEKRSAPRSEAGETTHGTGTGRPAGPERPPGPTGPTGPPPRTPDRGPVTRPPKPCEEEPEARVLPATGPLFPEARVLPEAPPFTDMLPVPFDGPLAAWFPSGLPLAPWTS